MKSGEKGFTVIELLISITIMAVASIAASGAIFQIFRNTERNNDHITAVRQVQNAGYWISRDAQMSQSANTDNLTSPNFLIINWTEWDAAGNPIYHIARYFFEDLTTDGIGKLKRSYWSSAGASEQTLIADYIYYKSDDVNNTSKADYLPPVLTVRLTAFLEDTLETKEYRITRRPNF